MTTQATRKRATTDELIAKQEEKLQQLKARKRREQAREREARKALDRKKRARVLITIGATVKDWLKTLNDENKEKWVKGLFITQSDSLECREDRMKEASEWLRSELGLPASAPPVAEPQEVTTPADAVQQPPAQ